tara:strand:+ start:69 stop:758 length:690 start_codon:yes stop_codon:yes gene_type:complete
MNKDKVSVLMSAYNSQDTIGEALDSLVNQTYKNIEILVIDDGSKDKTFKICLDYAKNFKNIVVQRGKKNIGLTKSLNLLINMSNGNLIARQDADDISDKRRIEKQVNFLNKYNLDAVTSRAKVINQDRTIPRFSYYLPKKIVIKYKNPFIHGSLLIKKTLIQKLGGYDEMFYYAQDYKLMSDLISAEGKIRIMKEPLYLLNMENNISSNMKQKQQYFASCVRKGTEPTN